LIANCQLSSRSTSPTGWSPTNPWFSMLLDEFALQHRLGSETTVVEAFVAVHPS
jgi:hypothetical protein